MTANENQKRWILEVSFSLPTGDDTEDYDFVLSDAVIAVVASYAGEPVGEGKFEKLVWPDCGDPTCGNNHGEVQGRTERFEFHGDADLEHETNDGLYLAFLACQLFGDAMYLNVQDAETGVRVREWSAFDFGDEEPDPTDPASVDEILNRARNLN